MHVCANPRGLDGLSIARYELTLRFDEPAVMPQFPGATLRGAFGTALKSTVCVNHRRLCSPCLLRASCLFTRIFDTTGEGDDMAAKGRATPPRPFVIDPPHNHKRAFEPGDAIVFTLTLFGEAAAYLPYFVFAFSRLEMMGLGRARARFTLCSVKELSPRAVPRELYNRRSQTLAQPAPPAAVDAWLDFAATTRRRTLSLQFVTPVRVKAHHHYQSTMPFDTFWNALRRRIDDLFATYGRAPLEIDWSPLYETAPQLQLVSSSLRWAEFERFSHRQQTTMTLGGLIGDVTYRGPLSLFLPWIQLGQIIHIGKNTTFGFGKYLITEPVLA